MKVIIMVLSAVKRNNKCRIKSVVGGGNARKRIYELGLNTGAEVKMVKNDFGPIIISISGHKLAIGRGLAQHIYVEE
ncbi:MAG: FeoA domain-containing protein [Gudongella sp.]|nr:FeoA domain-containing protein [Gudongella sp.]